MMVQEVKAVASQLYERLVFTLYGASHHTAVKKMPSLAQLLEDAKAAAAARRAESNGDGGGTDDDDDDSSEVVEGFGAVLASGLSGVALVPSQSPAEQPAADNTAVALRETGDALPPRPSTVLSSGDFNVSPLLWPQPAGPSRRGVATPLGAPNRQPTLESRASTSHGLFRGATPSSLATAHRAWTPAPMSIGAGALPSAGVASGSPSRLVHRLVDLRQGRQRQEELAILERIADAKRDQAVALTRLLEEKTGRALRNAALAGGSHAGTKLVPKTGTRSGLSADQRALLPGLGTRHQIHASIDLALQLERANR